MPLPLPLRLPLLLSRRGMGPDTERRTGGDAVGVAIDDGGARPCRRDWPTGRTLKGGDLLLLVLRCGGTTGSVPLLEEVAVEEANGDADAEAEAIPFVSRSDAISAVWSLTCATSTPSSPLRDSLDSHPLRTALSNANALLCMARFFLQSQLRPAPAVEGMKRSYQKSWESLEVARGVEEESLLRITSSPSQSLPPPWARNAE